MINQEVIKDLTWLLSLFKASPLVIIGGIFTIYFGIQKLSKKVAISYQMSSSRLYDQHIPALIISNKRDNAIAISSIDVKVKNKFRIKLIGFESPLVLKAYDTVKVDLPKYSSIYHHEGEFEFGIFDKLDFYIHTTSGQTVHCDIESSVSPKIDNGMTSIRTVIYENLVLTDKYSFVLTYYKGGKKNNMSIDRSGMFHDENPFPFNYMPVNEITKENFENVLLKYGIHDYLDNYYLTRIDQNLSTEVILTKRDVAQKSTLENI